MATIPLSFVGQIDRKIIPSLNFSLSIRSPTSSSWPTAEGEGWGAAGDWSLVHQAAAGFVDRNRGRKECTNFFLLVTSSALLPPNPCHSLRSTMHRPV